MLHFSRTIHHMIVIYGANVLNDIARCFFNFKILIFQLVKRLKGQKMAQNDKNSCLLHLIFQEPCIIYLHLWYTCIYKRIIYPGIFFIFFLLIFGIIRGRGCGKRVKSGPKWQKTLSFSLCISGTIHHMIVIYGTHVWNDISRKKFYFSKFWFLRFLEG